MWQNQRGNIVFRGGVTALLLLLSLLLQLSLAAAETVSPDSSGALPTGNITELRSRAAAGDALAQLNLGYLLFTAEDAERNYVQAAYWFRQAANQQNAQALFNLAICFEEGLGVERNPTYAFELLSQAARLNLNEAKFAVALRLAQGVPPDATANPPQKGVAANRDEAQKQFAAMAAAGDIAAGREYAMLFFASDAAQQLPEAPELAAKDTSLQQELAAALQYLERGAAASDALSERVLADCYYGGFGVERNETRAFELLTRAANRGEPEAILKLAFLYANGIGCEVSDEKAFELFQSAWETYHATMAAGRLGSYYLFGRGGVTRDIPRALQLLTAGCEANDAYSLYLFGLCLRDGIGMQPDRTEAMKTLTAAAAQELPEAQYELALLLLESETDALRENALDFLHRAARQHHIGATRELAKQLFLHDKIEDREQARQLLELAAEAGDREAILLLQEKNRQLPLPGSEPIRLFPQAKSDNNKDSAATTPDVVTLPLRCQ